MATRRVAGKNGWTLVRQPAPGGRRRRGGTEATTGSDIPAAFLQSEAVRVEEVYEAVPAPAAAGAQRRAAPPDLVVEVDLAPGEASILAIRHPSGAITFHPSTERVARSTRRGPSTASSATAASAALFRVPVRRLDAETGRRGIGTTALKVIVLKVAKAAIDKAVSVALPILAARWEKKTWEKKGLREGWFHVAPAGSSGLTLTAGTPPAGQRSLLLLHGTFSNANGAFGALAHTSFFSRAHTIYDDRIYAFNHFSISRTPHENTQMLLDGLPAGEHLCDVITHSRGGLVLRNLVEHASDLGAAAGRFHLGHAVLVASPNDGTPLATPKRWEETVGWFANLMELFPDNPFTTGAEFVSESLVWLASHLAGDLPGLRSMDGAGELVKELQSPPGPPAKAYSALVSNYHPEAALWQRALDVGADEFFGSANDLVVPTEGGWRIDRDGTAHIPSDRIGCFGPGGNLGAAGTEPVHHINFFGRNETADFLVAALSGATQKLTPVDPDAPLPDRRFTRGGGAAGIAAVTPRAAVVAPAPSARPALPPAPSVVLPADDADTFHLVLMPAYTDLEKDPPTFPEWAHVLASYAGARVMSKFRLRRKDPKDKDEKSTSFGKIIAFHESIKSFTDDLRGTLPSDEEMIAFGGLLFDTLFQGDVRRLYDEARARQRTRKLDFVLTSQIAWIAEKPWEFCYDTARKSFLATEEIHFVRNVVTAVPADPITRCVGPLRILIASAQPVNFGVLSIEQEMEAILSDFQPLTDSGLATIEILQRATPEGIHRRLENGRFDIVHFIGHGEFDKTTKEGVLVFEDERGGPFKLGERSVRQIFCGRGLSLVFLNSCQSARGGRSDFNKGVAQSLVAHGLPALVANQYSVLDASATSFARYFYSSLAQGYSLGHAAREARIAVNYSLQGDLIDWAVPVLYARDANQTLCIPPAAEVKIPMLASAARVRRRPADQRLRRVAVWDIEKVFPSLEKTLDRMNAAQDVFGFELVEMSAPLDAWDRTGGGQSLRAEVLAMRLGGKPMELQVDVLACITRHPLKDKTGKTRYGWWPAAADPPVGIFSTAGLGLPPQGAGTDRAIANTAVAFLARFFAKRDAHPKGPKTCPFFQNEARDVQVLTREQKFDAACRKELRKVIAKELPALDALLKAF